MDHSQMVIKRFSMTVTLLLILMMFTGCRPYRNCPVTSLLLDVNNFPLGTTAPEFSSPMPDEPYESAGREFLFSGGFLRHKVIRYRSKDIAAEIYNQSLKISYRNRPREGPWIKPAEIEFKSAIADQYVVACGLELSSYVCYMNAQYQEYYVFIRLENYKSGLALSIFNDLLHEADKRMVNCISISK
jgi:hypothetical protein